MRCPFLFFVFLPHNGILELDFIMLGMVDTFLNFLHLFVVGLGWFLSLVVVLNRLKVITSTQASILMKVIVIIKVRIFRFLFRESLLICLVFGFVFFRSPCPVFFIGFGIFTNILCHAVEVYFLSFLIFLQELLIPFTLLTLPD